MSDINATTSFSALGLGARDKSDNNSKELGQDDFLQLMVTQLKNQDPFKPMESGDFLGQIAQFGTVNGIEKLQESFSQLASSLQSNQALQASSLVGRKVMAAGNKLFLESGQSTAIAAELPVSTEKLTVQILDASGQVVRTMDLGSHGKGLVKLDWDGLSDQGDELPTGVYSVSARIQFDGVGKELNTLVEGKVDSVTLGTFGQSMMLNLSGLGSVSVNEIKEIK